MGSIPIRFFTFERIGKYISAEIFDIYFLRNDYKKSESKKNWLLFRNLLYILF